MSLLGIDHVLLAMPAGGEAEARAFYGGLLGLSEADKPEPLASRGGCWFGSGRMILHLGVQADFVPAAKAHPALLVDDMDALFERLRAAGVDVTKDEALPGTDRFYARDPFNNRIEFIRNGHGFSQR